MNNKKNIAVASVILVAGLAGGYCYFFVPGVVQNISTNTLEAASGTDNLASDVDISSSSDVFTPFPVDATAHNNGGAVKKVSKSAITKNNVAASDSVIVDSNVSDKSASSSSPSSPAQQDNASAQSDSVPSCPFPSMVSSASSQKIIFNEIAWMGSASSSNAEWMEIKNNSAVDADLSGWQVVNASGKITIPFSSGDTIPADGFLLLSRNNSSTGKSYSGNLVNTGDILAIVDPQCAASDIVDASSGWPAGNNTTKQTMERDADGIGWHTSLLSGGTPGAENSAVVLPIPKIVTSSPNIVGSSPVVDLPPAASSSDDESTSVDTSVVASSTTINSTSSASLGHILIAAVQIAGASSTNDFVKIYNPTGASMDVSGWKLHKHSQTGTDYSLKAFPTGSVIAPAQYFVWANSTNGYSEAIGANVSSTETLSADNSVAVLDTNGTTIDALAWGSGTNQYGEGQPYPTDPAANQILTRQLVNGSMVDTSNNASDFLLQ